MLQVLVQIRILRSSAILSEAFWSHTWRQCKYLMVPFPLVDVTWLCLFANRLLAPLNKVSSVLATIGLRILHLQYWLSSDLCFCDEITQVITANRNCVKYAFWSTVELICLWLKPRVNSCEARRCTEWRLYLSSPPCLSVFAQSVSKCEGCARVVWRHGQIQHSNNCFTSYFKRFLFSFKLVRQYEMQCLRWQPKLYR